MERKLTITERSRNIEEYMRFCFDKARSGQFQMKPQFKNDLESLFATTSWGFREIVLVITVAKHLDRNYSPTTDLYNCNPRSIYEGPIKSQLLENNIPHRKSGPLNIAKATAGLTSAWAAQREPKAIGEAVVRLAKYVESISSEELDNFSIALHSKFVQESIRVAEIQVEYDVKADIGFLIVLCFDLINKVPDAGNTPQRIAGLLLKAFHADIGSPVNVTGYDQRASTTSTTSNKPGDINEEGSNGSILSVYEITVKPFGIGRIIDSHGTITSYNSRFNKNIKEVMVVCRPLDIPDDLVKGYTALYMGMMNYKEINYCFLNIYEWLSSILSHLTDSGRRKFYESLQEYIADINTSELVKREWADFHSKNMVEI